MAAALARKSVITAILFAAAAGLVYWRTRLLPSPVGPARRLSLDDLPASATVDEQHCYLVDAPYAGGAAASGLLLRGHLPSYVRRALEQKGLNIATGVLVFNTDPDFGRTGWYAAAALLAIGAFASLVLAFASRMVSKRTEEQMDGFRVRAPAYLLLLTGLMPVVSGIALSAQKAVHIAKAAKADGIVEDVQESRDSLGKYSFYLDYSTPQGRFHEYASTSTPFSKAPGDKVTILYKPDDPRSAELLTFDTDWLLCTLLFAAGAVFIAPGAMSLARSNARRIIGRRKLVN
jgi:hypothetical protein